METTIVLTQAQADELAAEYERLFRERTPARLPQHVLASSRVTFTDLADYWHRTHRVELSRLTQPQFSTEVEAVRRRLRREFPNERWR